jgi:hypothetical protein
MWRLGDGGVTGRAPGGAAGAGKAGHLRKGIRESAWKDVVRCGEAEDLHVMTIEQFRLDRVSLCMRHMRGLPRSRGIG